MKFSKKILETFIDLPKDWQELMEDVGLEVKSIDGDIINLELLANRGDHYCYMGLMREVHGRNGAKIKYDMEKMTIPLDQSKKPNNLFKIETDKCLAYSLTPYKLSAPQKVRQTKDKYILDILNASGVNVILDIIDITNVVMLEHGQPAHVYDADKIKGKIHIRETKAGEKAALLFHDGLTEIPAGTCVIADEEKILCVAGVIGCHGAEADENTKNILVETALFNPVAIRLASRVIGHTSIASQIFERGGNYDAIANGATRAKKLYEQIGWIQNGEYQITPDTNPVKTKPIKLDGDFIRSELEIKISDSEIEQRLLRYGFDKTKNGYQIPAWRVWDIKGEPADLIEELCRSIGYNALPSKLPPVILGAKKTDIQIRKSEIDSYLVHNGFYEVITDSMYSPKHASAAPNGEHIALENSVEGGYAFMRNNTIVQAAELVGKNLRVKNREIRAFEWGKIFKGDKEIEILWGVMNGANTNALTAKTLMENLFNDLSLTAKIEYDDFAQSAKVSEWKLLNPKRRGRISCNGLGVCVFGEIHPNLLNEFDIKNDLPVYFSFDTKGLMDLASKKTKYNSPSAIVPSVRDIAVAVPYGRNTGDVAMFINKEYKQVADVKITDVYDKTKESVRNITFSLTFAGEFSTEELNKMILEIMESANKFAKK